MIERIRGLLEKALHSRFDVKIEVPADPQFGDYSTNAAWQYAAQMKKSPLKAAGELAARIKEADREGLFQSVEVAPPGFINFRLTHAALSAELAEILARRAKYGAAKGRTGEKVQVEYVSANPTGPLTMANGRGGFLGDVLSNVLTRTGYRVEREYYVNDTGNQVLTFGKSFLAALGLIPEEETFYRGAYIGEWARRNEGTVKKYAEKPLELGRRAAKEFLKTQQAVLKNSGIRYDRFTSEENHIRRKKYHEKALMLFRKAGYVYEKDGAVWLKTTAFGDDKDRVLVTGDGFPTYFLGDAGHYLETKKRGFNCKINILGPDHYGYVKRIQAAAKLVGLAKSEVIVTQAVRVVSGGQEVKMSKRKGTFITFEEVAEEVGKDAARFFFLMHSSEAHMDFDLDLAKERSQKNPVYYAQYAYVRAKNILEKAKVRPKPAALGKLSFADSEGSLTRKLVHFPDLLRHVAETYEVHSLTQYATDLARAFHNFYERERVIGEPPEVMKPRLALVAASKIVLENLFRVLGIEAPEKM